MSNVLKMLSRGGAVAAPTDPNFNQTVLLLHGDGTNGAQNNTFLDSSTNNFTITRNGNTTQGSFSPFSRSSGNLVNAPYDPAVHGGSGYFDGTGDRLDVAASIEFAPETGDFTYEAWVNPSTTNVAYRMIFGIDNYGAGQPFRLYQYGTAFRFLYTGSDLIISSTITSGVWYHLAITRSGSTVTFWMNGVSQGTATQSTSYPSSTFRVGMDSGGSYPFSGYISNVRIVKGTALYTSAFTPPTAPLTAISGTGLLLNFTNAGIFDNTGKNNLETVGNAQIDTATKKYGTGSIEFDGTGDYLTLPSSTEFGFGTGAFTVEFWLYLNTVSGTQNLFDMRSGAINQVALTLYMNGASPRLYVSNADRITGSNISTGQWYHIALTRSGTDTKLFVDGTQSGSTYSDSNNYLTPRPLRIGTTNDGTPQFPLNGFIDDFRITKGVARYTANFTPPTAAFPDL